MNQDEWPRVVGQTEYRGVKPADVLGGTIVNADHDAIFIIKGGRKFVAYLRPNDPVDEYRRRRGS